MNPLGSFADAFNDPHARHALLVHIPIALALLGILPALAWLVTGARQRTLALVASCCFAIASAGAALAAEAGEDAAESVEKAGLTTVEKQALEKHEELGENGWVWPLIPCVVLLLAGFPQKGGLRLGLGALGVLAGAGVGVWVALTGHAGGQLVYTHGLGVPARTPGAAAPAKPGGETGAKEKGAKDDD